MPIYPERSIYPHDFDPRFYSRFWPPYYPYWYPYRYYDDDGYYSDDDYEYDSLATEVKTTPNKSQNTHPNNIPIPEQLDKIKNKKKAAVLKATLTQPAITEDEIKEITDYINNYRQINQAPPITWDTTIAQFSQSWANYLLKNNLFQHSGTTLYGENLAYFKGYGTDLITLLKQAVDMWYNEIKLYDFNNPVFSEATGHFTALVWKSTTNFGIGFAINPDTTAVDITMNFSPPGNVEGEYTLNVLPAISSVVVPPTTPTPNVVTPSTVPIVNVPVPPPPPPPPPPMPMPYKHTMPPPKYNMHQIVPRPNIHRKMETTKNSATAVQSKAAILSLLYNLMDELNKNKSKENICDDINNAIIEIANS